MIARRMASDVPVSAGPRDFLHSVDGFLKAPPGGLKANTVDIAAWRHTGLGGEGAGELAWLNSRTNPAVARLLVPSEHPHLPLCDRVGDDLPV
jgi:hypothetical protein